MGILCHRVSTNINYALFSSSSFPVVAFETYVVLVNMSQGKEKTCTIATHQAMYENGNLWSLHHRLAVVAY